MVEIEASDKNRTCRCLPSCYSVDYDAEILKTDFNLKNVVHVIYEAHNWTADKE